MFLDFYAGMAMQILIKRSVSMTATRSYHGFHEVLALSLFFG
jgi:hypothetical protein